MPASPQGVIAAPPLPEAPPRVAGPQRRRGPRRVGHQVALALGCFALVLAALLPWYVYPRLAVLPDDPRQTQVLRGSGATVLLPDLDSPAGARVFKNRDVTVTTYVTEAPVDRPAGTVVWDLSTKVEVEGHGLLDARVERISLDAGTGEPTNCCGDRLVTDRENPFGRAVVHQGFLSFPFAVAKRDYLLWDVQLGRSRTARYLGEETRAGLRTYRFEAETPFENVGTRELPGRLFRSKDPSVAAIEQYADTRTFWVEPATGVVVDLRDELHQRFVHGGRSVTAMKAELVSPPLEAALLGDVRQGASYLPWLRWRVSALLIGISLALLLPVAYRSWAARASRSTNRSASRWQSAAAPSR